jgi:protein phosphatase
MHINETAERVQRSFREANERMAGHPAVAEGRAKMGTTLVAAVFAHGRAVIGNVGDSRCYRLRSGTLERLTENHSYAAQLWQTGVTATPQGREAAEQWAHVLTRCLNGEPGVSADTRIVGCEPGDVYLLCSDGLWGIVADHVIGALLGAAQDADQACERLVGAAWAGGGLDNIGIAVARLLPLELRVNDPSWLEQPTQPGDSASGDL